MLQILCVNYAGTILCSLPPTFLQLPSFPASPQRPSLSLAFHAFQTSPHLPNLGYSFLLIYFGSLMVFHLRPARRRHRVASAPPCCSCCCSSFSASCRSCSCIPRPHTSTAPASCTTCQLVLRPPFCSSCSNMTTCKRLSCVTFNVDECSWSANLKLPFVLISLVPWS